MFSGILDPDANTTCPYLKKTYYEWDTGYTEYGCTLGDSNPEGHPCWEDLCPLRGKWRVEE